MAKRKKKNILSTRKTSTRSKFQSRSRGSEEMKMNQQRQPVELTDTTRDLAIKMSEGNPGALTVLCHLMERGMEGLMNILALDDMNMRGPQIWVAFKDFAGQDLNVLIGALQDRSQEMVDKVNSVCTDRVAVKFGGSRR